MACLNYWQSTVRLEGRTQEMRGFIKDEKMGDGVVRGLGEATYSGDPGGLSWQITSVIV